MPTKSRSLRLTLILISLLFFRAEASAAEVKVMISGGFSAAYQQLAPEFERVSGHKVTTAYGPSMGTTPQAIPNRLQRGEPADVVIMVGYALDGLIKDGKVAAGSRVDLAKSSIGAAVRAGAPQPDIGSSEALKRALLAAKSIAYSDSASGVYISTEMFKRLGIEDELKPKSRMIPAEPVGKVVARGEAELGFQQISELRAIPGIVILGPIPADVQKITVFSAGIATGAQEPVAAKALVSFLASSEAGKAIADSGLTP